MLLYYKQPQKHERIIIQHICSGLCWVASPALAKKFYVVRLFNAVETEQIRETPYFSQFCRCLQGCPRQGNANTDADCIKYCTRIQDIEQLVEYWYSNN